MIPSSFDSRHPLIVIGSGLAGLLAARVIADEQPVQLFTKKKLCDSNTQHSQGGIAAVWSPKDSTELHIKDTLEAGRGLCDYKAVQALSQNSRSAIQQLIDLGVIFDRDSNGQYSLGLEGAHSLPRILYAGGDATGAEIQRALAKSVLEHPNIQIHEDSHVKRIVTEKGAVVGIEYASPLGETHEMGCRQLILATGGAGQLYQYTSNPETATGEGNVLAYLAGAELTDLEFFQFHPTGLSIPNAPNFLISEAVRGEGAILINSAGNAIMEVEHPLKDLAPRDIVARAIFKEQKRSPDGKVFLDATAINAHKLETRFPTILANCAQYQVDIRTQPIPITPVAHYMIGGVSTDLFGRTTVRGLYACGEIARTGVHGSNRLASNSLLECSVFSIQAAKAVQQDQRRSPECWQTPLSIPDLHEYNTPTTANAQECSIRDFQRLMWNNVSLIRNEETLKRLIYNLQDIPLSFRGTFLPERFELFCLKILGRLIAQSALQRKESRGSHFRSDYPDMSQQFLFPIKRSRISDTPN